VRVKSNGIELFTEVNGDGDPLVLSHGWMSDQTQWKAQVTLLSRHHKVIAYDHRGHGSSDKPKDGYSMTVLAEDIIGLLDALGLDKATIVGHSMGGMASLVLAIEHPERVSRLVLVETSAKNDFSMYMRLGVEDALRSDDSMADWMVSLAHRDPSDQVRKETLARASQVPVEISRECLRQFMTHYDVRKDLGQIEAPTMIVVGEKDSMTPVKMAQVLHRGIAGSSLEIIPEGKHMPMIDDQATFNHILSEFLG
jgi:3-oxoadipate enol-lactonase